MPLVVETGTGNPDAESYISVADADTYHSNIGNTEWASLTETRKEQCLRLGTMYMQQNYNGRWLGSRTTLEQALDWPRVNVRVLEDGGSVYGYATIASNVIPREVKSACADLALRANMGPLTQDLSQGVLQETAGPITVKYDPNSARIKSYVSVNQMVAKYMRSSSGMVSLNRV